MYHYVFRTHDYPTYFFISSIFFFLSTLLAVFWNFELYNRSIGFAIIATVLGPISRNIFVEIMPASSRATISDRWRNSEALETEEIKNFTLIFAAMFEDLPQACVNLAFLSHPSNDAPVGVCGREGGGQDVLCCVVHCSECVPLCSEQYATAF
jgi:hypothetical protein